MTNGIRLEYGKEYGMGNLCVLKEREGISFGQSVVMTHNSQKKSHCKLVNKSGCSMNATITQDFSLLRALEFN